MFCIRIALLRRCEVIITLGGAVRVLRFDMCCEELGGCGWRFLQLFIRERLVVGSEGLEWSFYFNHGYSCITLFLQVLPPMASSADLDPFQPDAIYDMKRHRLRGRQTDGK